MSAFLSSLFSHLGIDVLCSIRVCWGLSVLLKLTSLGVLGTLPDANVGHGSASMDPIILGQGQVAKLFTLLFRLDFFARPLANPVTIIHPIRGFLAQIFTAHWQGRGSRGRWGR